MALVSCNVQCTAGGFTRVTFNCSAQRTGGDNDKFSVRVVRRGNGGDAVLPGAPNFVLTGAEDIRSWTWIDANIPVSGAYLYVLQIMRLSGVGTFYEIVMTAEHFKK